MAELTEFELRLFEWIRQSDFETVAWSSKKAAKSFKCKEDEIYEGVAALTRKLAIFTSLQSEYGKRRLAHRWTLCALHKNWKIHFETSV